MSNLRIQIELHYRKFFVFVYNKTTVSVAPNASLHAYFDFCLFSFYEQTFQTKT